VPAPRTVLLALVAAVLAAPAPSSGGPRTLSWRTLEVEARLDGEGDLHVRERQVIVFDGDWNGGERRFRLAPGQRLRFERLLRETPEGGTVAIASSIPSPGSSSSGSGGGGGGSGSGGGGGGGW